MKLIITRHGETKENKSSVIQGRLPGELSEKGHRQSMQLGKRLSEETIDKIYCSTSKRCKDTLDDIISSFEVIPEIEFTNLLQERDFGKLSGKVLNSSHYLLLDTVNNESKRLGIESIEELMNRTEKFLNSIIEKDSDKTILILTHSNNVRTFLMTFLNKTFLEVIDDFEIHNCSYTEFEVKGKGSIKEFVLEDISYLKD